MGDGCSTHSAILSDQMVYRGRGAVLYWFKIAPQQLYFGIIMLGGGETVPTGSLLFLHTGTALGGAPGPPMRLKVGAKWRQACTHRP